MPRSQQNSILFQCRVDGFFYLSLCIYSRKWFFTHSQMACSAQWNFVNDFLWFTLKHPTEKYTFALFNPFFFRLVWQHSRQCWGWKAFITRADVTSAKLICHETFVYVVWWVRVVTNESFYCYNQVSLCALKERKEDFCPKKRKNSLKINTKQLAWLASIYLVILHIPHAFAKNWDARITLRSRSTPDFCL